VAGEQGEPAHLDIADVVAGEQGGPAHLDNADVVAGEQGGPAHLNIEQNDVHASSEVDSSIEKS